MLKQLAHRSIKERLGAGVVATLALLHFALLAITPPGFYQDEAATGSHVVSILNHHTNALGTPWPLFSPSLGGGYTTPTYLYPLSAWGAIAGTSPYSLRAFSQVVTLLAIFFVGLGMYHWTSRRSMAYLAWITGLTLPWAWVQGSLAWDPALVPLFIGLGFYAFAKSRCATGKQQFFMMTLVALDMVGLAYTYPPCRVTAPLLLAGVFLYWFCRGLASLRQLVMIATLGFVVALPLLMFVLDPVALARTKQLSVFYERSILDGIILMIQNFFGLFNPDVLFFSGDPNLRHNTTFQGLLGLAALPPLFGLLIAIYHRRAATAIRSDYPHISGLLLLSVLGISASYLGSALTAEGQPHSLRACAAWPFYIIALTLGWHYITTMPHKKIHIATITTVIICTVIYIVDLTCFYPARSRESFDTVQHQHYLSQPQANDANMPIYYQHR